MRAAFHLLALYSNYYYTVFFYLLTFIKKNFIIIVDLIKGCKNMLKVIIILIAMIIILLGTISIFEARNISKKFFSFGDQNSSVAILKIIGFIVSIIGLVIIKINM